MEGKALRKLLGDAVVLTKSHSYVEGIVRGYRNNLLNSQNYGNLTQCETVDGV